MRDTIARLPIAGAVMASLVLSFAASAEARDPAPITYASASPSGASSAPDTRLARANDDSYGYGASPTPTPGPVIDLRRPPALEGATAQRREIRTAPVRTATSARASEQGTPAWLEHERVGPPYQANGQWFVPTPEPGYSMTGTASWYGPTFHGQATASGEPFDQEAMTAAHPTLPIPSLVQVTNLANGREIIVRVNDRGPFVANRVIDLSHGAATVLGFDQSGTAQVHVRYLGPAPRHYVATGAEARSQPAPVAPMTAAPAIEPPPVTVANNGPMSLLPPENASNAPSLAQTTPAAWNTPPAPVARQPQTALLGGGFMVQIGAYADLINAHRVRDAVASAGAASVDSRTTPRGELFRVRLGPFANREDADAARRSVASLGYGDAVLASR